MTSIASIADGFIQICQQLSAKNISKVKML